MDNINVLKKSIELEVTYDQLDTYLLIEYKRTENCYELSCININS